MVWYARNVHGHTIELNSKVADGPRGADPIMAKWRQVVVETYVRYRQIGFDHANVLEMIGRHYGTTGQDLLVEVLTT